jgi:hypothetical protein
MAGNDNQASLGNGVRVGVHVLMVAKLSSAGIEVVDISPEAVQLEVVAR